jgi:hypothetical protein
VNSQASSDNVALQFYYDRCDNQVSKTGNLLSKSRQSAHFVHTWGDLKKFINYTISLLLLYYNTTRHMHIVWMVDSGQQG